MHSNRSIQLLISLLFFALSTAAQSPKIVLHAQAMPLDEILTKIHKTYQTPISFDPKQIKHCLITIDQEFDSASQALEQLAQQCNCSIIEVNKVFVVINTIKSSPPKLYWCKGTVLDKTTKEKLPYAFVQINDTPIETDENGYFMFQSKDSVFNIHVAHIGYTTYQKISSTTSNLLKIALTPNVLETPEVVVVDTSKISPLPPTINSKTSLVKLTPPSIPFLAGNNTNSLFSFTRLQAGVQAAGEQSKDFIIWGSYKGQSHILYDGITIFSPSTYNDLIGIINPMMIQDVEIRKGGYGVAMGDRVGAVVNIHSKNGNPLQNKFELEASNQILQLYTNIKLPSKGSIQWSIRHAIPNFFTALLTPNDKSDFQFTDMAVKYYQPLPEGWSLKVSLLGNYDYSELFKSAPADSSVFDDISERRLQFFGGGNISLHKNWKKIGTSQIDIATSMFQLQFNPNWIIGGNYDPNALTNPFVFINSFQRGISEFKLGINHQGVATKLHQWQVGLLYTHNYAYLIHQEPTVDLPNLFQIGNRLQLFWQEKIHPLSWMRIQLGIKGTIHDWNAPQLFLQPRGSIQIRPHPNWQVHLATGLYQQFIAENSIIDKYYNHIHHWTIADGKQLPVIEAFQQVVGLKYRYKRTNFSLNGYYKHLNNIATYLIDNPKPVIGVGRSYGVELAIQTAIKKHQFWLTYSLSKTEECFCGGQTSKNYTPALHDQRHELKFTGLFNWYPWQLSVNYVLGSGIPNTIINTPRKIYSRLDAAFIYHLNTKHIDFDFGCSFVNIMNTPNVRYRDFILGPNTPNKTRLATPFSPNIFVKVSF